MYYPELHDLVLHFEELAMSFYGRVYANEVDVYSFSQVWPTTSCGWSEHGSVSGQAFTKDMTTVLVIPRIQLAGVCFGNRAAYLVHGLSETFWQDLKSHNMAGVSKKARYGKTD